jgi:hypothetical protein
VLAPPIALTGTVPATAPVIPPWARASCSTCAGGAAPAAPSPAVIATASSSTVASLTKSPRLLAPAASALGASRSSDITRELPVPVMRIAGTSASPRISGRAPLCAVRPALARKTAEQRRASRHLHAALERVAPAHVHPRRARLVLQGLHQAAIGRRLAAVAPGRPRLHEHAARGAHRDPFGGCAVGRNAPALAALASTARTPAAVPLPSAAERNACVPLGTAVVPAARPDRGEEPRRQQPHHHAPHVPRLADHLHLPWSVETELPRKQ